MRIERRMSRDLITIASGTSIQNAIKLMKQHSVRHLPVVDDGRFVGFVTESDLRGLVIASMLDEITIDHVMITNPLTVRPDDSVEKAALLLYTHKIGGLPVVQEDGRLVGIITVADVLEAFIEFMGMLQTSARLDVVLKPEPDSFEKVSGLISEFGGQVISVGVTVEKRYGEVHSFRLKKLDVAPLAERLNQEGHQVIGWEE